MPTKLGVKDISAKITRGEIDNSISANVTVTTASGKKKRSEWLLVNRKGVRWRWECLAGCRFVFENKRERLPVVLNAINNELERFQKKETASKRLA